MTTIGRGKNVKMRPMEGKFYGTSNNLSVLIYQIIKLIVKCVIF